MSCHSGQEYLLAICTHENAFSYQKTNVSYVTRSSDKNYYRWYIILLYTITERLYFQGYAYISSDSSASFFPVNISTVVTLIINV